MEDDGAYNPNFSQLAVFISSILANRKLSRDDLSMFIDEITTPGHTRYSIGWEKMVEARAERVCDARGDSNSRLNQAKREIADEIYKMWINEPDVDLAGYLGRVDAELFPSSYLPF